MKTRLDGLVAKLGLSSTRSQAENLIKLGLVSVNGKIIAKPGYFVDAEAEVKLKPGGTYVSRAGLKLAGVAKTLGLSFKGKTVLDVGSSTGGFTDFALRAGAKKVVAVDVGTDQMNPVLAADKRVELHEKTDIRSFKTNLNLDIILIDVSFISLTQVLPPVAKLASEKTQIITMVKPQFEAKKGDTNKGVIKNAAVRRKILLEFEAWAKKQFVLMAKADSQVPGEKGNIERFYMLMLPKKGKE